LVAVGGLTAALGAIEGALKAAGSLADQAVSLSKILTLPDPFSWAVAIGLLALGIWIISLGNRRRSRLLRPDALRLRTDEPSHLKGRDDDLGNLVKLCRNHRLVFLVGESGAGKSALVRAGLCRQGVLPDTLVPIMLDGWGDDWAEGPISILIDEVRSARSLTVEDREALDLPLGARLPGLLASLKRLKSKRARTPLLIFDQFDDYQIRHRDRFRDPESGAWKQSDQIVAENAFWQGISNLLASGSAHVLIVTRSDTASGLDSVRLTRAETYPLDRPRADEVVLPILKQLTGPDPLLGDVVGNSENGWEQLTERLARDLKSDGQVLPIQLRTALLGLPGLRRLTVRAYEHAGGVRGLEVRALEEMLPQAERESGLNRLQISRSLLGMVDVGAGKTIPAKLADLALAANVGPDRLDCAFRVLGHKELIRTVKATEDIEASWRLDHDYWCLPVVALEKRLNFGNALLRDAHQAWREAKGDLIKRWRALLTPRQQIALLVQYSRGRCAFGPATGFALLSTLRWLPFLVLIGLGFITYVWDRDRRDVATAEQLFAAMRTDDAIKLDEIERTFWPLASASEGVRWRFLEFGLKDAKSANRLRRRIDVVAQAAVGTYYRFRDRAIDDLLVPRISASMDNEVLLSCVLLGNALHASEDHLAYETKVADRLAQAIAKETDLGRLSTLTAAFASVVEHAKPEQAAAVADRLAQAVAEETNADRLSRLATAFVSVVKHAKPEQAAAVADRLAQAVAEETDAYRLSSLTAAFASVVKHAKPEQAAAVADRLAQAVAEETDAYRLSRLATTFASVGKHAKPEQTVAVAGRLAQAILKETDLDRRSRLTDAFASVVEHAKPEQAAAVADRLAQAIAKETNADRLSRLTAAFASVAKHVKPEQAAAVVDRLAPAIAKETNPDRLSSLSHAIGSLAIHLKDPVRARQLFRSLLSRSQAAFGAYELSDLSSIIAAFPGPLDSSDLVNVMKYPNCTGEFRAAVLGQLRKALDLPQGRSDNPWPVLKHSKLAAYVDRPLVEPPNWPTK
jgi:GGDEF domain-containing protein